MKSKKSRIITAVTVLVVCAAVVTGLFLVNSGQAEVKSSKKAVILYFSGTGNTTKIAKKIKKASGAGLINIKAKDPYTDSDLDYSNDKSRVVKEHESASSPAKSKIRPEIANLNEIKKAVKSADIVYIGYPIWWGEAPHIMYTLVENVSFSGKKVIPFNSSFSSGTGSSSDNLKKDAKINSKTDWLSGKGFTNAGPSQRTISKWVKKVNK